MYAVFWARHRRPGAEIEGQDEPGNWVDEEEFRWGARNVLEQQSRGRLLRGIGLWGSMRWPEAEPFEEQDRRHARALRWLQEEYDSWYERRLSPWTHRRRARPRGARGGLETTWEVTP